MADREEYKSIEQQAREGMAPDNRDLRDTGERAPAPVPDREDGESHWNNPENVKNAIHYFAEVRPAEREAMQAGRGDGEAKDTRDRAADRGGDKPADDRKPGREEYQPGSYKPAHDPASGNATAADG
jgi:hypothetical protein